MIKDKFGNEITCRDILYCYPNKEQYKVDYTEYDAGTGFFKIEAKRFTYPGDRYIIEAENIHNFALVKRGIDGAGNKFEVGDTLHSVQDHSLKCTVIGINHRGSVFIECHIEGIIFDIKSFADFKSTLWRRITVFEDLEIGEWFKANDELYQKAEDTTAWNATTRNLRHQIPGDWRVCRTSVTA